MKKYLTILILITVFSTSAFAQDISGTFSGDPLDVIFRSSAEIFQGTDEEEEVYTDTKTYEEIDPSNMPFFKQMRLRLTNKYLDVSTRSERAKQNNHTYTPKWKIWDKNRGKFIPIVAQDTEENLDNSSELAEVLDEETSSAIADLTFESGINTEVTEKQLMLDSDNINFDEETGDMIATGRPFLSLPPQNTTVIADKMTYNDDGNILKGIGNVIVTRDGKPMLGDYLEIDMNEEAMYMDNMLAKSENMNMKAQKAVSKEGMLIFTNGNIYSEKETITRIATKMVGPRFENMIVDPEAQSLFFGSPDGNDLTIHIDNIEIDARKNHDVIKAKNIKFYRKDKNFFRWPGLTVYTNKNHDYFEGNYPEFGSKRKLGMFIGPGFAFSGPLGSVIKVIPFINYQDDFGFGGMIKYVNTHNYTELGYGTANDIFFLRGKQRLDDNLYLQYSSNSYTDEWFLGARMAKYMAEINYDKSYLNRDFLAKGMDLTFRHKLGFGVMEDDDRSYNGERFANATGMSTTRTRYMAEINQTFINFMDRERRLRFNAGVTMQGSAALYGTGDTQFVARFGPVITTQYKNWMQTVGYLLTGYDDKTPMPRYDAYRYGTQSVYITEAFRLSRYVAVGWSGYINISDDAPNGKMFQENAFIVSLGPDDFKIVLGYDFERRRTYFGFNVAFDPKGTNIAYDKMIIKNPERLGKQEDSQYTEQEIAFAPSKLEQTQVQESKFLNRSHKPQILQYAQIIDIEDPEKEKID